MKIAISSFALIMLVGCASQQLPRTERKLAAASSLPLATSYKGEAKRKPWGGYWWSMENGETVLGWDNSSGRKTWEQQDVLKFEDCLRSSERSCQTLLKKHSDNKGVSLSPLMKFDLWAKNKVESEGRGVGYSEYAQAARNELEIHYIGDNEDHPHYEARGYAGKCTGWTMSNFDWDEPTKEKVINGVLFTPADIKAILATIYNGAQFFISDEMHVGNAYRSNPEDATEANYEDVYPHDLLVALAEHIGKQKKVVAMDMEPSEGVWNHPVWKYEAKLGPQSGNKIKGNIVLHYGNDIVKPDDVFSTGRSRPDHLKRSLDFELIVPVRWNKDIATIKESRWVGSAIDEHPDTIELGLEDKWRETIYDYRNTDMKKEVNFQLIKKVRLNNKWTVAVDELLKEYYQN